MIRFQRLYLQGLLFCICADDLLLSEEFILEDFVLIVSWEFEKKVDLIFSSKNKSYDMIGVFRTFSFILT